LDEVIDVTYKTPKGYDKAALQKINHLMRSPDDKEFAIPVALIELIDDVQDHFGADAVEIISGYRSPTYNGELKKGGRSVANESLHKQGIAADIHIDEVTEEAVKNYAESLKKGGVGYYPVYDFVHVDIGPVRTWGEAKKKERILVGTEANPNNAWRAVTNSNEYRKGDTIEVSVTNTTYETAKITKNIWYEHFRKGKWAEHEVLEKQKKSHIVKPGKSVDYKFNTGELPYGKYRLVIFTSEDFNVPPVISNEFYIKKE
jgi:uncharacterized protein YcbK (DUF882 family)